MTVEKRANIRVTAKTDQAAGEFEKLAKAQQKAAASLQQYIASAQKQNASDRLGGFDAAAGKIAKSDAILKQFSGTASGIAPAFRNAALGLGIFVGVASAAATQVGELAARSFEVQGVFNNLAISIEPARNATQGLISDFQLAKSANTLLSFGVVKTADEFAQLSQAAQALGVKLGLSAESTMESLSAALGRNSKLMLDNLGIILSIPEAEERYAKSLGKTAKNLTDTEKAEAFRKEAMKAIFAAAKDVTIATDGAAASVQRFGVELDNMRDRALGAERPTITLKEGIAQLSDEQRKLIPQAATYGSSMIELQRTLRLAGVSVEELSDDWTTYRDKLALVVVETQALDQWTAKSNKTIRDGMLGLAAATKSVNEFAGGELRKERLKDIERELALLGDDKKARATINGLLHEKAEITAYQLELSGELEKAEKVRFEEEIREIKDLGDQSRATAGKMKGLTQAQREFRAALMDAQRGQLKRDGSDSREFAGAMADAQAGAQIDAIKAQRKTQLADDVAFLELKNQTLLDVKLKAIELEQAAGLDPWSLNGTDPWIAAQREADARLFALEQQEAYIQQTLTGREKLIAQEELEGNRRDILATRELARIAKDQRERDKYRARMQVIGTAVSNVHTGIAEAAIRGAFASGEGAKAAVRHFAAAKAQEMLIVGATEIIQAGVAAAMWNFPLAAQHAGNSAAAFAQAGLLGITYGVASIGGSGGGGAPSGGGGGGGGLSGGSGGGGSGVSIGSGPPISRLGPAGTPTPAGPLPPRAVGGATRSTMINVTISSVLPPNRDQMINDLRRLVKQAEQDEGEAR